MNIRVGKRADGKELHVAWTVQSAEKGNQYLEREARTVSVEGHPRMTHWYVTVFKMLQHTGAYKSARIWVKHDEVVEHLAGAVSVPDEDPRAALVESIKELANERFLGCEFAETDHYGSDIEAMLAGDD